MSPNMIIIGFDPSSYHSSVNGSKLGISWQTELQKLVFFLVAISMATLW